MIKIIITIITFIAAVSLAVKGAMAKKYGDKCKSWFVAASAAFVCCVLLCMFTVVPAGHTGVLVTAGKVSPKVLSAGAHFKIPLVQSIVNIDNRVQRTDVEGSAASKDLQTVTTTVSVNCRVIASESANLYSGIGKSWDEKIIRPAVQEGIKAVMAQFTAEELITKRQETSEKMSESISKKIERYGLVIDDVNVLDMDFSKEFNDAIEAKQTAQQNALKAEQDLARIEVEARQKVVQAQADAEANRIRSESITDKILISEYLEKWDGKMPSVVGDGEQIIDISSLLGK